MRLDSLLPVALSVSLLALTGCDALLSAPQPNTETTGNQQQVTPEVTDPAQATRHYMYVMNGLGKTLDEVDLATMAVTPSIMKTGSSPNQLLTLGVVTYVVNSLDHTLLKLDLRARKTLATIHLDTGANPTAITSLGDGKAVVTNWAHSKLTFVDLTTAATESTLALTSGAPYPESAVASGKVYVPANKWAADWSALEWSGVYVVDLASKTVLKTIELEADANPSHVSVDPGGQLWVGVKTGLVTIDPSTDEVSGRVELGARVTHVQFVSATKAYGKINGGLVSFNPQSRMILRGLANMIPVAVDEVGTFKIFQGVGYVSNFASDSVSVVDLDTEAASGSPIPVGDGPQDLTFVTVAD